MPALCRACDNCYLFIHSVAPNARYTATSQTLEASEFQTFPPLWMERLIYSRAHLGNPEPWEIGWIALLKAGSLGIWLSEAIIVPKNKILPPLGGSHSFSNSDASPQKDQGFKIWWNINVHHSFPFLWPPADWLR